MEQPTETPQYEEMMTVRHEDYIRWMDLIDQLQRSNDMLKAEIDSLMIQLVTKDL